MQQHSNKPWICQKCGTCCYFVFDTFLDRGDGICKHLQDNLCTIYDNRPDICNTKTFKRTDEELNYACNKLREIKEKMDAVRV